MGSRKKSEKSSKSSRSGFDLVSTDVKEHLKSSWKTKKAKMFGNKAVKNICSSIGIDKEKFLSSFESDQSGVLFLNNNNLDIGNSAKILAFEKFVDYKLDFEDEDDLPSSSTISHSDDIAVQYYPHTAIQQPSSVYYHNLKSKKKYSGSKNCDVKAVSDPDNEFLQNSFRVGTDGVSLTPTYDKYCFNERDSSNKNFVNEEEYQNPSIESEFFKNFEYDYDPYPMWDDKDAPIKKAEIALIFKNLSEMFGFQADNEKNMYDYFLRLLDSRASRMNPLQAITSLYLDYIGGKHANFRKWYFASKCDDDDFRSKTKTTASLDIRKLKELWLDNFQSLTIKDYVTQISLYLLIWGEAGQVRYMPELICFIYKTCIDRYYFLINIHINSHFDIINTSPFLDHVITPIYNYYRDQQYEPLDKNVYIQKNKDHVDTIGYDDINQHFWFRKSLLKISLKDCAHKKLYDYPTNERYLYLNKCDWKLTFKKTYRESRTWYHIFTNFNRIWIIHVCVFWYYTIFNAKPLYTNKYQKTVNNPPSTEWVLSLMSLSGSIAAFINLLALFGELSFCPRNFYGSTPIFKRISLTFLILFVISLPTVYIGLINEQLKDPLRGFETVYLTKDGFILFFYSLQFIFSLVLVTYYSVTPLNKLYFFNFKTKGRDYLANIFFTDSIVPLKDTSKLASIALWLSIFFFKFLESYFFLTLSLKDTLRELSLLEFKRCTADFMIFGDKVCKHQKHVLLVLVLTVDLILFFLDTYLWYVIGNTLFSVFRSLKVGVSIWTPWKNIFLRLPSRIYIKILNTDAADSQLKIHLVSEVWNLIIVSMYREHLISFDHVQSLIYNRSKCGSTYSLKEPNFFYNQEDTFGQNNIFKSEPEAQRRMTFFAQSLSTSIPNGYSINKMPSFTVLIPHYKEKIMLSLKDIIKTGDTSSQVSLLEYLKGLHSSEWKYFIDDTKKLLSENDLSSTSSAEPELNKEYFDISKTSKTKLNAPINECLSVVGFQTALPEYVLRTRIWVSLRSQTLYKTITGFMNYDKAIKILYEVEDQSHVATQLQENCNSDHNKFKKQDQDKNIYYQRSKKASIISSRKFRLLISMQRLNQFDGEENENLEYLLRVYPELQIAYIENILNSETNEVEYYSCLIDGTCNFDSNGKRQPKYKIKLSGNPILGDGKADNQNLSIIFARGEFIQLIDANQDNYIEECLKIRNVLSEFEIFENHTELSTTTISFKQKVTDDNTDMSNKWNNSINNNSYTTKDQIQSSYNKFWDSETSPVAIIGTREYIFSENIGVLGDVAAGKEQTFGTLTARTLAEIGGKLHYGHPDFLNTVFVTTRGGVSKGQKGLHLNEDIYSGMNALMRGGRIKHCEYIQCGKGRDLGFESILNFTTKIGAGMGEQFLSREYYYLGTQLPLDRFLSFYYGHAGFHLNNILIVTSIKMYVLLFLNLSFVVSNSVLCYYNKNIPYTDPKYPTECANIIPVIKWLRRSVLSIFSVFLVAFFPLFFQELMEKGTWKAVLRISKHFLSFSPLFEVFVCKVYSTSVINDLTIGGARYISTGRGFATTRTSFSKLYSRFAPEAFYYSSITLLVLMAASISAWEFSVLYFWMSLSALIIAPLLFNPNQFSWNDFFLDYKRYLRWLSSGNTINKNTKSTSYIKTKTQGSWINYIKELRATTVGSKKQKSRRKSSGKYVATLFCKSPSKGHLFLNIILNKILFTSFVLTGYIFANSQMAPDQEADNNYLLRAFVVSISPLAVNFVILVLIGFVSITTGPILSSIFKEYATFLSTLAHSLAIINHILFFQFILVLQRWSFALSLLTLSVCISIQNLIIAFISCFLLTKEMTSTDRSNKAWWTGRWFSSELGRRALTQPLRELICKWIELSWFTSDFLIGHFLLMIQTPLLFIPCIDRFHSFLLFWLKPSEQISPRVLSLSEKRKTRRSVLFMVFVYFFILTSLLIMIFGPLVLVKASGFDTSTILPDIIKPLLMPKNDEYKKALLGLHGYKVMSAKQNARRKNFST